MRDSLVDNARHEHGDKELDRGLDSHDKDAEHGVDLVCS